MQTALRLHEPLVGRLLLLLQARDRLARLRLARLEGGPLFLQPGALGLDQTPPVGNPRPLVVAPRQLHVEPDELLLEGMLVGLQRAEHLLHPRRVGPALRDLAAELLDRLAVRGDPFAQRLHLPFRTEQSAGALPAAAREPVRSANHDAFRRRDRVVGRPGRRQRLFEGRSDPPLPQQSPHRGCAGAGHLHDVRQRPQRGMRRGDVVGGRFAGDEKAATSLVAGGRQRDAGQRIAARRHHDLLQEVRKTRLDGALVAPLDLQVVGHRSVVGDLAAGRQDLPRRVSVGRPPRLQLPERLQAGPHHRDLLLARPQIPRPGFDGGACRLELRGLSGPADSGRLQPLAPARALGLRLRTLPPGPFDLGAEVRGLGIESRRGLGEAAMLGSGVVDDVLQRRRRVDRREHFAAGGLDVALPPLDRPLPLGQGPLGVLLPRERRIALDDAPAVRLPLRRQLFVHRIAARLEGHERGSPLLQRRRELGGALPAEIDLLLASLDLQLAAMRRLADRGRLPVGLRQLDPQALAIALQPGQRGGGSPLARPRLVQAPLRGVDGGPEHPAPARETDLLPPAQLVAQPAVAAGLGGLPLERAALFLHLEDDVVDARQVLLRGLELQLRGAAPRLVLRDPRRLFQQ